MMKLFQIIVLAAATMIAGNVQAKKEEITLVKIAMFDDRIEMKVPSDFSVMHDFQVKTYYPENDLPKVVYTNAEKTIRIAFNFKKNGAEQYKIPALRDKFLAAWKAADPKLKEISNGVVTVDARDMGFVGVMHKAPEKMYRFLFLTDYKGYMLTGELVCPKKGYKPWVEIGNEIMNSVDIKG